MDAAAAIPASWDCCRLAVADERRRGPAMQERRAIYLETAKCVPRAHHKARRATHHAPLPTTLWVRRRLIRSDGYPAGVLGD